MNRARLTMLLALVVAVGWLLVSPPVSSQVNPPPAVQPKWEYAVLTSKLGSRTWQTPKKTIGGEAWAELQKEFGLMGELNVAAVLTKIGSEGWELVSHTSVSTGTNGLVRSSEHWTFKRPVK